MADESAALLEKVIALHSWDPTCLELAVALARAPDSYRQTMREVEACLRDSAEDQPVADASIRLPIAASHAGNPTHKMHTRNISEFKVLLVLRTTV